MIVIMTCMSCVIGIYFTLNYCAVLIYCVSYQYNYIYLPHIYLEGSHGNIQLRPISSILAYNKNKVNKSLHLLNVFSA